MDINWTEIEKKWQNRWKEERLSKTEPNNKDKFMIIFAYPYPTGFLHTGHMRGYSYADVIARYNRLLGKNVCFPIGLHMTGNGAIAKAQKIAEGDQEYISFLKEAGVSNEQIQKMQDVEEYADFFARNYLQIFSKFGLLLDERSFVKTTDKIYNQFITWQFHKLKEKELLTQKPYYATACVKCGPVAVDPSEADISKGGTAEKNEYTLLKFKYEDKYIVAATLRPETVFGQTNLWLDPNIKYSIVKVNNEEWICSEECAEKLKYQKDKVEIIGKIKGSDMIGNMAIAPMIKQKIIILPSEFCDPNVGTGIVTSVPSDAPHDWMGLYDLQRDKKLCEKYGLDWEKIKKIKVIPIINTPGWGEAPAVEICEKMHIKNQKDKNIEKAKKEIYKSGFYSGTMRKNANEFAGLPVEEAKEQIKNEMINKAEADFMHDLSEEVICRCGNPVIIKKVDDQWFIDYGKDWLNQKCKNHAKKMKVKPDDYYNNLPAVLEWFKERPCARMGRWLGTTFPFDDKYTIEAISDSTLYPIFYLVSKYQDKFKPEWLTLDFFDYIYLNKGDLNKASEGGMPKELIKEIKNNVDYWYPLNINLGGKEHKTVHFPPFIKNHVAILPENKWPQGVYVNYWVTGKGGSKLSKSKGDVQPVPGALKKFGADGMRLFYANIGSPHVDIEFDEKAVAKYTSRIKKVYDWYSKYYQIKMDNKKQTGIDQWFENKMNHYLYNYSQHMNNFELKKATDIAFFNMLSDIEWYIKRNGANNQLFLKWLENSLKMMAPFTPHIAEEIWANIFKKDNLISTNNFIPIKKVKIKEMDQENYLKSVIDDINNIINVAKINNPDTIKLYTADPWKWYAINLALQQKDLDYGTIFKVLMNEDRLSKHKPEIAKFMKRNFKKIPTYRNMEKLDEYNILKESKEFLENKFGCQIEIDKENETQDSKASFAMPMKPAIKIE